MVSMQFGFNIIFFSLLFLTLLYFQLRSLSIYCITEILLTISSCKVWKLLYHMTCQCRYTQGIWWILIDLYFYHIGIQTFLLEFTIKALGETNVFGFMLENIWIDYLQKNQMFPPNLNLTRSNKMKLLHWS